MTAGWLRAPVCEPAIAGVLTMTLLLLGLILFIGSHSIYILAPGLRQLAIARIGSNPWRGVQTLVSFAGLAAIVVGYGAARLDPVVLWTPPSWTRHLVMTAMIVTFPVLIAAFIPSRLRVWLKHPMLAAVTIWALVHLVANGTLADVLLFGSFLIWTLAARVTLIRRPMSPPATAAGVKPLNDLLVVTIGIVVYAAFLFGLHAWLTGMPLL